MSSCPSTAQSRPTKILLVEDDEDFRNGLAANLREDGYDVREFAKPAQLPPMESLSDVQFVITDYDLPAEDGLRLVDRFHAANPEVPVAIVTAYATPNLEAQVARRQFASLLRKPLDYDTLHALLERAAAV